MLRLYRVTYQNNLIGVFRAFSEQDAVTQAYMNHGSASRYTGRSKDHFVAEVM